MTLYRGRFAPSPTGPLHLGSLVAALGSYLEARQRGGDWLLRIEDLDMPRVVAGASDAIQRQLARLGLRWDGDVVYQSQRQAHYQAALEQLRQAYLVYPCDCPRSRTAGGVYDGRCRLSPAVAETDYALRLRTDLGNGEVGFDDGLLGRQSQHLPSAVGDFILRRRDGLYAYQLAVVVDDAAQGVTHVVRGADLLDNTPRQIYLQTLLGLPTPAYSHLPVLLDAGGLKLSKQNHAPAVDTGEPLPVLLQVWALLQQAPPPASARASVGRFWEWAVAHWNPRRLGVRTQLRLGR